MFADRAQEITVGTLYGEAKEAERISAVLRVAVDVLGSSIVAHEWLESPIPAVRGARPIELVVASEQGLHDVLAILRRLDHGVYG